MLHATQKACVRASYSSQHNLVSDHVIFAVYKAVDNTIVSMA